MEIKRQPKQEEPSPESEEQIEEEEEPLVYIPTGSTMLNLACSDKAFGGYGAGKIVTTPGASQGSKTLLAFTMLAEANKSKELNEYAFIKDDVEQADEFDIAYLFGEGLKNRLDIPPNGTSDTIEQFKANMLALGKKGTPFIYVLDSFDALTSGDELEKEFRRAIALAKSEEAAKKIAGSFGMEKAKIAGQTLRMIKNMLAKTHSLLVIIQQLRQNADRISQWAPKYITSGGEAPFFYSAHQIWLTKTENIKEQGRKIGARIKAEVKKNKLTGKLREVEFDAYYDYGIDNISSCIDFLLESEHWKKDGHRIKAEELKIFTNKAGLVKAIEGDYSLEIELYKTCEKVWLEIEESLKLNRRRKYE